MPEPLKYLYNQTLISALASCLKTTYAKFDVVGFQQCIFDHNWDQKELKERMNHIAITLHQHLSPDYQQSIEILKTVSKQFTGLEHMFFPAFVELYGLDDFGTSMTALEFFTSNSSSEFAIRPFIKQSPVETMSQMNDWAESENYHVRRLASEGCRPRLPWAMALPGFKRDPAPVITILEKLKHDENEYVRRSVANNLNDISKDNPEIVIDISMAWLGESTETDRLIKHACRSLLKQGEPRLMEVFGFKKPGHISILDFDVQQSVAIGDKLNFSFQLQARGNSLGKLRIEYAIDFMKSNGRQSRKVFKISESDNPGKQKSVSRQHSFKYISTRKYYPGIHGLAIIINGQELMAASFDLTQ